MRTVRRLPPEEPPPLGDVYADARTLASDYPAAHLPALADTDAVALDQRWRALLEEMSRHPELSGRYCD